MKHNLFPKTKNKAIVLLASLAVLFMVSVTGTLAYLIAQTSPVVNTFTPGNVKPIVSELFDDNTKSDVKIQNTGNVDAYIRAEIVVNWVKNVDGYNTFYWKKPVSGTDYNMTLTSVTGTSSVAQKWIEGSDGFYYWTSAVKPGDNTGILISACSPVIGKAPEGYVLSVEILSQAIQADGTFDDNGTTKHPVQDAWSTGVSGVNNGVLQIITNTFSDSN